MVSQKMMGMGWGSGKHVPLPRCTMAEPGNGGFGAAHHPVMPPALSRAPISGDLASPSVFICFFIGATGVWFQESWFWDVPGLCMGDPGQRALVEASAGRAGSTGRAGSSLLAALGAGRMPPCCCGWWPCRGRAGSWTLPCSGAFPEPGLRSLLGAVQGKTKHEKTNGPTATSLAGEYTCSSWP